MGSRNSSSQTASTATTTNTDYRSTTSVVDKSVAVRDGTAIWDSVIVSNDDAVVRAAVEESRRAFEAMIDRDQIVVSDLLGAAQGLFGLVSKGIIQMSGLGAQMLDDAIAFLGAVERQGERVIDLADDTLGRSFDLSGSVISGQQSFAEDVTDAAFDLARTAERGGEDLTINIAVIIALFGVAAMVTLGGD